MGRVQRYMPDINKRLRDRFYESGLTLAEITRRTGLAVTTVRSTLYWDRLPDSYTLYQMCKVLDISADYVLYGKENINVRQ